jgi:hypothetical protein
MSKSKAKLLAISFGSIMLAIFVFYAISANRMQLIAEERIRVLQSLNSDSIVGEILAGEIVPVVACYDAKIVTIPIVKLKDGQIGYVLNASFHLEHDDVLNFNSGMPINFSCPT